SNRRRFLKSSAAASVGFWVAGRATWADELASKSPNERINVACIGIGGKGDSDSAEVGKHANLVAICDVDDKRLDAKHKHFPHAQRFNDFRKMFDTMGKEIDAVTISTPDHTHAVATMMAIKLGKHVYTQKPMTHDVWEARQLRLAAREYKIASQMGNQGTSSHRLREGVEAIRAGIVGPIKEVHIWTNRPIWPQSPAIKTLPPEAIVPAYLHFDEWLGSAPARPYAAKYYHPFNWRGWWDFGTGALGDMGCHVANLTYMGLNLGHPDTISAECEEVNSQTYPGWARITYEFPARGEMPPVKVVWYEGRKDGKLVQPPDELTAKVMDEYNKLLAMRNDPLVTGKSAGKKATLATGGWIAVGEKGMLYSPRDDGNPWEALPAETFHNYQPPTPTLPRNPLGEFNTMDEGQKIDWLTAIKGGPKAPGNFDYAGMLTEFILLGNVAIRENGTKLKWDGPNMTFPNAPKAEKWLKREYRAPWKL
ncbi:MAG TPA: Gfo/Idh/MocA family oxidoreductase, partial [Humisphaera sp.]|nr:Gfo/Idh/MocA family oxidoreductase [Humisphaera sp.]